MIRSEASGSLSMVQRRKKRRRLILVLIALLIVVLTAERYGRLKLWPARISLQSPEPPRIPESLLNPAVGEVLSRARDRVLERPESSRTWGFLGMSLMQHELPEEALQCFTVAAQLDPRDARWDYYAAVILEQRDLPRALSFFESAVQKSPNDIPGRLRYASALISLGLGENAVTQLKEVQQRDPTNPVLYLQLMRADRTRNAPDRGMSWLHEARQNSAVSQAILEEAAQLELIEGRPQEADRLLREAQSLGPDRLLNDPRLEALKTFDASGTVAAIRADELRQQGQIQTAAMELRTLSKRFPERSRPAMNHALALRDQGLVDEAIQEFVSLKERFATDPVIRFHLAVTLATAGRNADATRELESCLELKPDYGMARAVYGDLLQAAGRSEEGIYQSRMAVKLSPGDLWIRIGLIELLRRAGNTSEAATEVEIARTILKPNDVQERNTLDEIAASLGKTK